MDELQSGIARQRPRAEAFDQRRAIAFHVDMVAQPDDELADQFGLADMRAVAAVEIQRCQHSPAALLLVLLSEGGSTGTMSVRSRHRYKSNNKALTPKRNC